MSKLNRDILHLIFKELNNNNKALFACLSVNKIWCELIIPILWRDPWKYLNYQRSKSLLDVIISHFSDEKRNNLMIQLIQYTYSYKKPLFNYINLCKHLNLNVIRKITLYSGVEYILNEIICLFVNNEDTEYTHLYIPRSFDYQIHLIPGAERCFSNIEFLSCYTNIDYHVLAGLTKMCKSIKELEIIHEERKNNSIFELIKTQESLLNFSFISSNRVRDESFCKSLEKSLIKHADTMQHFKMTKRPNTQLLSYFINLKSLELNDYYDYHDDNDISWKCLENLSLPFLQILNVNYVPVKFLAALIENTSGYLTEIVIYDGNNDDGNYDDISHKRIIQAIYMKCPKLKYLELKFSNSNLLELEKLLINCQYLIGLFIIKINDFDWDNCFEILSKSSPIGLYEFEFGYHCNDIKPESLKLFFDNWKGRHPMLLQFNQMNLEKYITLIEEYKERRIIENFNEDKFGRFESEV
jgi:hypothetical protein